ncbi:GNAT family N-acetyltransferase [Azospirillum sp.]|uniref:GNAT family N-acetyltransferase n=1 Tax=Azospirillum sp. TaxID=34012 RepID=UPI003D71DD93
MSEAGSGADASTVTITPAGGPEDIGHVRALFREYARELNVSLCFQGFEEELAELPGKYAPPDGALLLARVGGEVAGVVGLRPLGDGVCEMKRMYVRPPFRGTGAGRLLAERIVAIGREAGYHSMRLDTLGKLTAARALYERLGFREIPAYYHNPLDGVLYYEKTY